MSKRRTIQTNITDKDRFGMTFFLATIFHGMVILGVTFSISPLADSNTAPALDIILVQTKSPVDVENADYLAQVSQQGGGDAEEKSRPRELFSAPTLSNSPGVAMQASEQQVKKQKQNEQVALLTQENAEYRINTEKTPVKAEDDNTLENNTISEKNTQTPLVWPQKSATSLKNRPASIEPNI